MSRNNSASRKLQLLLEALESRDVPSAVETTFAVTLPDSTTVTGEFSTPSAVDPSQEYQSLSIKNLVVTINGNTATISGTPTAEFAYGDLLGVTASANYSGTTVQIDDAIATDGGADAQIGYVAGTASSASGSGSGTGTGGSSSGSGSSGGGSYSGSGSMGGIGGSSGSGSMGGTGSGSMGGGGSGSGSMSGSGGGMYTSGSGSISGIVFEDANGNGTLDSGESGISGVTVNLLETNGTVYATATTNGSGAYSFTDLSNAPYLVSVETSETFTAPGQGTSSTTGSVFDPDTGLAAVSIVGGQAITGIDAGLYTPVTVEGSVFVDAGDTGYFGAPDAVLTGDAVSLENSSGTVLQSTSSVSGEYEFSGLAPGTYQIAVGEPLGYTFTTENATGNPSVDSGVNASTGISSTVTLADGASAATINAGLLAESGTASISGTITTNASGSSAGASGLTVQLIDPATGTILQTTTTDGSGDYSFTGLVAGTYSVTVQSNENITSGGAFDAGTYTASETVTSGQTLTGVNSALTVPEQMTFSLDSYSGSISYSIPWSSVDPTQASQSIALSDFSMTIGSQTFYEGSTTFSTSPAVNFSYGEMTGLTFAFNPSGAGVPYSSLSMSNSMTLSGYNTTLGLNETSLVVASTPSVTLDFSKCTVGPGKNAEDGVAEGKVSLTVTVQGKQAVTVSITVDEGTSAVAVCVALQEQLKNCGLALNLTESLGTLTITGTPNNPLVSVYYQIPAPTANFKKIKAGGAKCGPGSG